MLFISSTLISGPIFSFSVTSGATAPVKLGSTRGTSGCDHYREVLDYDHVRYVVIGAISDKSETPEYLKIDVSAEGLTLDFKYTSDLTETALM